jgi:ankyrin repeat protein
MMFLDESTQAAAAIVDIHALAKGRMQEKLDVELLLNPSRINEHEPIDNKTVLHIAAEAGNLSMIQMLVTKHHASINERGYKGQFTPLCFAVTQPDDDDDDDDDEWVDADDDDDLSEEDGGVGVEGGKAMYPMTKNTRTSVVKFLLENGASANVSGLDLNIGPLEWACQNNFVDIVKLLLVHGADVNCQNEFGYICLDSLYNN